MANDQKNEQSVMVSIDDILSQDPHLSGGLLNTPLVSEKKDEIDLSALQKIGAADREDFMAPASASNIAFQPIQLREKKTSPVLTGFLILIGAIGLIVGGIYLGEVLKSRFMKTDPLVQNTTPPQQVLTTTPPQQVIANNSTIPPAQTTQVPGVAENPTTPTETTNPTSVTENATPENQATTTDDKKQTKKKEKTTTKVADKEEKSKEPEKVESKAPVEEAKAPVKTENSEVNNLLKGLKGGKKPEDTSSTTAEVPVKKTETTTTDDSGSSLPEKLEGRDVLDVIRKNQPNINRCKSFATEPVKINVRVTIANTGAVQNIEILDETHKTSPLGKCLEEKIKQFKFPAFSTPSMSVKLPFNF